MRLLRCCIIVCVIILSAAGTALSMDLNLVSRAASPRVLHEGVLFTYESRSYDPDYVMVSGDFDNWREARMMMKNENGIFVYLLKETRGAGVVLERGYYKYRYLVDGVWMNDPENSNRILDSMGEKITFFRLPTPLVNAPENPVSVLPETDFSEKPLEELRGSGSEYVFYLREENADTVHIVGDFNNFNPYSHPLYRNTNGLWEIRIDIPPGRHTYRFLVDGQFTRDPLNKRIVYDRFDNEYSLLLVP